MDSKTCKRRKYSVRHVSLLFLALLGAGLILVGCQRQEAEQEATTIPPTATMEQAPTATPSPRDEEYVTIATDAPYPPFSDFDDFGTVVGFDAEMAATLLSRAGYEYEFVVTNFEGMLESVARGEFDVAISALTRPNPQEGIRYTDPYLEVGQVLVVLANEEELVSYHDIPPGVPIGVLSDSAAGQRAARDMAGVPEANLQYFDSVGQALQALIDGGVSGVILDHDDAQHYTRSHYEQLKIAGGSGREAWITEQSYVIAVDADRPQLLEALNEAIGEARADGSIERITRNWLVSDETIDAGESLIGTRDDIIVIGVLGQLDNIDPAAPPSNIGWEVKYNTMSGLYMFDAESNLVPVLATGAPDVSEDKLEYTFTLRSGLTFPDGSPFTAEDVRWSINRAASRGNWHVNAFLKDNDGDFIADADAVQVISPTAVRIVLKRPTSYFPTLLATPPYFVVSQNCYDSNNDAARTCSGIGPYEVIEWPSPEQIQLQANPQWFGPDEPLFDNVQIRFYADAEGLQAAMELGAIDMAWGDIPAGAMQTMLGVPEVQAWDGPPTFKSYVVFQQEDTPWENPAVRQAAALAVDREALAREVFQDRRRPLYSPLPSSVPQHVASEPQRDLERAQDLLRLAGYSESNPLVIPLWYLNDGRYTILEEAYATALKEQWEETGMIEVELSGAPWDIYAVQMSECNYATFLLGWPPVGWPTRYPAAMGWLDYFVSNTDTLCSNYESTTMSSLIEQTRQLDPGDEQGKDELYSQIQALWAQEYPTLDLMEAGPRALAHSRIQNVKFDRMGLLHYGSLTKDSR